MASLRGSDTDRAAVPESAESFKRMRRDPTIVARIRPGAESYTAPILLDNIIIHHGYQTLRSRVEKR